MTRRARPAPQAESDALIMSVRLASGAFDSSVRIPFPVTPESAGAALEQWMALMETGLRVGASRLTAQLKEPV